jgi:hypothetical protein
MGWPWLRFHGNPSMLLIYKPLQRIIGMLSLVRQFHPPRWLIGLRFIVITQEILDHYVEIGEDMLPSVDSSL